MPGYILHLTAAKMFWDKAKNKELYNENDFYVGNLLPDTTSDKRISHFRNPEFYGNMIEYPDLDMFLEKYKNSMDDSTAFGYYFHLYVDHCYFKHYFPLHFTCLDDQLQVAEKMSDVTRFKINATGEIISRDLFLSDEYYYGDYTRMNNYLIEQFNLQFDFCVPGNERIIEEVNYDDIQFVIDSLREFTKTSSKNEMNLKVFDLEDLLGFLKRIVEEW